MLITMNDESFFIFSKAEAKPDNPLELIMKGKVSYALQFIL